MTDREVFGRNVRVERVRKGLTQKELGDKLGVRQTTISMIESGKVYPEMQLAINLANFFGIGLDALVAKYQIIK